MSSCKVCLYLNESQIGFTDRLSRDIDYQRRPTKLLKIITPTQLILTVFLTLIDRANVQLNSKNNFMHHSIRSKHTKHHSCKHYGRKRQSPKHTLKGVSYIVLLPCTQRCNDTPIQFIWHEGGNNMKKCRGTRQLGRVCYDQDIYGSKNIKDHHFSFCQR